MNELTWIDTHIHVTCAQRDPERRDEMLRGLVGVLDRCDANLRMVMSGVGFAGEPGLMIEGNRMVYDLTRQAPGRLYGACMINPNFLEESLRTMEVCFGQWGFVVLGEMLQYALDYEMNTDAMETIVRLAVRFDVPVQVHISDVPRIEGEASSFGMEQLTDLFAIVDRVPEAKYILAHVVSDDLNRSDILEAVGREKDTDGAQSTNKALVEEYLRAVEEKFGAWPDNFWVEIKDFNAAALGLLLARVPSTRILAGTDWSPKGQRFYPYGTLWRVLSRGKPVEENPYPPSVTAMAGFLRDAGASDDVVEQIAFRNACDLLGIPVRIPAT